MSDLKILIPEIERQLSRMLECKLFQRNAQKGRFLEFVVRKTLAKEEFVEKDIREVFPNHDWNYDKTSNLVRITKIQLRDLLKRYYLTIGKFDPIFITLPDQPKDDKGESLRLAAGEAYKPEFDRN